MYIDSITLKDFRTFRKSSIDFVHPDCQVPVPSERPKLANMNLVIGGNGSGKTTLLKGVALAALGPAVAESGIYPYHLIRRNCGKSVENGTLIKATFTPSSQDRKGNFPDDISQFESEIRIDQLGDLERLKWTHPDEKIWHPIYSESSDAFFFVGYGANRRVENFERVDAARRRASSFTRARRIMSLFEESYSLLPLSFWLPRYQSENPERFAQARTLINQLLGRGRYHLTDEMRDGEYIFRHGQSLIPFPALSDGYRAFLGWIGDLLFHVCETCPEGKKLDQNQGIVLIDEVDLHIHPGWQRKLLPSLARSLPKIQFIVTSHSPLLVGSLEWRNVIIARRRRAGSVLDRVEVDVSKLDADQILLTELFGLNSTRSKGQTLRLRKLLEGARGGDSLSARKLMAELSGLDS